MQPFLSPPEHDQVVHALAGVESRTSSEIRVLLYPGRTGDPIDTAAREFTRLGLDRAKQHNAVLILLAPRSKTFAVHADPEVEERCGSDLWFEVSRAIESDFRAGRIPDSIVAAASAAGERLAHYYPAEAQARPDSHVAVLDPG